jgi:hypothetical protein
MMAKTTAYSDPAALNRALRKLPKAVTKELRDASVVIAAKVSGKAQTRGSAQPGIAPVAARSIRPRRDRVPKIAMGGSAPLPARSDGVARKGKHQTVGDIIWGAEFGSRRFSQFRPPVKPGYFLFATVKAESDEIDDEYSDALLDALNKVK